MKSSARERLPRTEIAHHALMRASEFPENASQELGASVVDPTLYSAVDTSFRHPAKRVRRLSAHPQCAGRVCHRFKLLRHPRRAPSRFARSWFEVMAAVRALNCPSV